MAAAGRMGRLPPTAGEPVGFSIYIFLLLFLVLFNLIII
jgi:hypothetical protein